MTAPGGQSRLPGRDGRPLRHPFHIERTCSTNRSPERGEVYRAGLDLRGIELEQRHARVRTHGFGLPQPASEVLPRVLGYSTADAENALAYAIQDPPDAILLDLRLPGMSGMELLEELVRRAIRIPVVVISGSADPDALRCLKLGALDYLQKPITIDRLRLAIDALDLKSLEQRLAEIDVSGSL